MLRKFIAVLACLAMICSFSFTITGCGGDNEMTADDLVKVTKDPEGTISSFTITKGIGKDGKTNFQELDNDIICEKLDADSGEFQKAKFDNKTIRGNYVRLIDEDGNEKADKIQVVDFDDSQAYWDPEMAWAKNAGARCEPAVDDETAVAAYYDESTIPYGERLLSGWGVNDWSGTVDFSNNEDIKYFSNNDYYNTVSSDTLTILPGYKTYLQPNGYSCGLCSILTVLEWYGLRGDLNDVDLAVLRDTDELEMGTPVKYVPNVFNNLEELGITGKWNVTTSMDDPDKLSDSEWVQKQLKEGHPIMVEWNPFGWHWQTIIGYDNMGTRTIQDDVLIMMDSYDTTDGNNDGYYIESYERLTYGICTVFGEEPDSIRYAVAYPEDWTYEQEMGDGIADNEDNTGIFTDKNKVPYSKNLAKGIKKYYSPEIKANGDFVDENGISGAAAKGVERAGDYDNSPYYIFQDFYNMEDSDTLHILTNYETLQQSTEYSCGATAFSTVANWFGMLEDEDEISLFNARGRDKASDGTTVEDMQQMIKYMNDKYDQDWVYVSTGDLDDPEGEESYIGDYCLQAGDHEEWYGLIPYLLDNDIPIMVEWDEWGGHWQTIIGYDNMGTVDKTQDDVLIFADPYDTTDHNQDGYYVDGFERLVYGFYSSFENSYRHNGFVAAFPSKGHEEVVKALGIK